MRRPAVACVVLAVVAVTTAAGCTNRQPIQAQKPQQKKAVAASPPDASGVQHVLVTGNEQFRFSPAVIDAKVGTLQVTLKTVGPTPHDLEIEPFKANTGVVSSGESRSVTVTFSTPGSYRFVCTFHIALNMVGTIKVT
jgi:plastocyanin